MSMVSLTSLLSIGAQLSGAGLLCGLVWLVLSVAWRLPADEGATKVGVLRGLQLIFVGVAVTMMTYLVVLGATVSLRPGLLR